MKVNVYEKKNYGYLDAHGILHIVSDEQTAIDNAKYNGKYAETHLGDGTGYPEERGKRIFVYAKEKEFFAGDKTGEPMNEGTFALRYPQTYALYKALI